jgi:hypothetical protein
MAASFVISDVCPVPPQFCNRNAFLCELFDEGNLHERSNATIVDGGACLGVVAAKAFGQHTTREPSRSRMVSFKKLLS